MNNCFNPINNLYKFDAYREVANNYDAAREILYEKKLAYGETAVVPFYYPDRSYDEKRIEIMMGIGALQGNVAIYSNILGDDTYADDAQVYIAEMGGYHSIKDAFQYFSNKVDSDASIYNALVGIKESIDDLTATLAEKMDELIAKP